MGEDDLVDSVPRPLWRTVSGFDIVSKVDYPEVDNAINQTSREIATRFDFKNAGAEISRSGNKIEMKASGEERVRAILDVLQTKFIKRGLSLRALDVADPELSGNEYKIFAEVKEGINADDANRVAKIIRDEGPKSVKAQVQGDELRVSSKSRDDLQAVQALLKGKDFDFAIQFVNYH
ncbi:YajQ family cyclic di-GMP-binding protein [Kitasatospora sp. NPDC088346]|uniref:YajQ family cyclic di-GMP-binding protein n=1 Tax=Kitasatospora sp. NPDC088346 TaxID=3364073 RepID=UPI0038006ED9